MNISHVIRELLVLGQSFVGITIYFSAGIQPASLSQFCFGHRTHQKQVDGQPDCCTDGLVSRCALRGTPTPPERLPVCPPESRWPHADSTIVFAGSAHPREGIAVGLPPIGCARQCHEILSARPGAFAPGNAGYRPVQRISAAGADHEPTSRHRVEWLPDEVARECIAPCLCRQTNSSCQVCTTAQLYLSGKWYRPVMFRRRHTIANHSKCSSRIFPSIKKSSVLVFWPFW